MRISILKAGTVSEDLQKKRGDYPVWFRDLLEEPGQVWDFYDVQNGKFPPDVKAYDAYIITGGPASAFDQDPWMLQLLEFVRQAKAANRRILGVCLGAQVLAQALGGEVQRNPKGWDVGAVPIQLTPLGEADPSLAKGPRPLRMMQMHRDIVARLPQGAKVLARSARTENEVFSLGDTILAVQGHPELDEEAIENLLETRVRKGLISPELAHEARESMKQGVHREFLQSWLRGFLRQSQNGNTGHQVAKQARS